MQTEYEIVKKLYRKKTIDKYIKKSIYLNESIDKVTTFLITRLFISIIIFFVSFILSNSNLLLSIILVLLFNYLYTYYKYDHRINEREKQLEKEASLFFEVLVLSLKSGKNLLQAMQATCSNLDNSFSREVSIALNEINYGKSLIESLSDFRVKISSQAINDIIVSIIEAYTLGKDMIESIEKELELLDEKRINDIKIYINKLPIKISVISVFVLIPLMLLLILSPVLLEYFG